MARATEKSTEKVETAKTTDVKAIDAKTTDVEEVKTVYLKIVEVEDDAVIVIIDGWRIRAYFEKYLPNDVKEKAKVGRVIPVKYTGDLSNINTVKLMKLTREELK